MKGQSLRCYAALDGKPPDLSKLPEIQKNNPYKKKGGADYYVTNAPRHDDSGGDFDLSKAVGGLGKEEDDPTQYIDEDAEPAGESGATAKPGAKPAAKKKVAVKKPAKKG